MMRRLEYARRIRSAPGRARNTAEAVMFLAAVARERHRLEQERHSLERRITRIDARLDVLTDTETKLAPALQRGPAAAQGSPPTPAAAPPAARTTPVASPQPASRPSLPAGVTEVTLQY